MFTKSSAWTVTSPISVKPGEVATRRRHEHEGYKFNPVTVKILKQTTMRHAREF